MGQYSGSCPAPNWVSLVANQIDHRFQLALIVFVVHLQRVPAANGPLWPYLVACIERDPTAAMLALGIDANSIRPSDKPPHSEPPPSPIGIESNPIGFQKEGKEHRTLSCVGFAHSPPSKQHPPAIHSLAELWAVVGCSSHGKASRVDRLGIARAAQQRALARHASKPPKPAHAPALRIGDDGLTRERDEYSHDLSAWD